jgi:hypothetical protein
MSDARRWVDVQRGDMVRALSQCESPAEARLLVEMFAYTDHGRDRFIFGAPGSGAGWDLTTQEWARTGGKGYRLDIALKRGKLSAAVEVDGWQWHHASDEQEASDAARDLALRLAGWHVIRIAAGRIADDASRCVDELAAQLHAIELHSIPAVPRPSPNADLIERLRNPNISDEETREILAEAQRRQAERLALLEARRTG